MDLDQLLNQIHLSSVEDALPTSNDPNQSLIDQLNLLDQSSSPVLKTQSFVYAKTSFQQDEQVLPMQINRRVPLRSALASKRSPHQRIGYIEHERRSGSPTQKSVREQLIEENQNLEKKLKYGFKHKESLLRGRHPSVRQNPSIQTSQQGSEQLTKLEAQYRQSGILRLYNFILRQFPKCPQCSNICDQLALIQGQSQIICKCRSSQTTSMHPLMGVLYDLENKGRFEQQLAAFQSLLQNVEQQIVNIQRQLTALTDFKEEIVLVKNTNRKKFKEINECKFYLRKHLDNLQQEQLQHLQKMLPGQYIQSLQIWRNLEDKIKPEFASCPQLQQLVPLYLQSKIDSKALSALHKILNYQQAQSMQLSISEPVRIPIKKLERVTLVVDGVYQLPVLDNVGHLELQFRHKKTHRELSLLFDNFPRTASSLAFSYDHKLHSHLSAEQFPFLTKVFSFGCLRKVRIKISNAKHFGDVVDLSKTATEKLEVSIKVSRHPFSQEELILPRGYYDQLIKSLGNNLVKFQMELPESQNSQAILDYPAYISLNKLCFFRVKHSQQNSFVKNNFRLLDRLDHAHLHNQQKKLVFERLICRRASLVRMLKKSPLSELKNKMVMDSFMTAL